MPCRPPALRRSILSCLSALAVLSACSRPDTPAPMATPVASGPVTPASTARVLVALPQGDGAVWQAIDPATGEARALGEAPRPVELWALDDARGEFYYRGGDAVWRDSWRAAEVAATRMAGLPPVTGVLHAAWVDAADGGLRVLEMHEPSDAEGQDMAPEPPDARPYLARLWAWRDGTWVQLAQRETSWGADGAVGPAVVDDLRQERGRSAQRVDAAAACPDLCEEEADAPTGVVADTAEEWRVLPGSGGRVRFGVALGERWQPVGPVTLGEGRGPARLLWPADPQGLRLHRHGDHLLVAPAHPPADAAVVELGTGAQQALPPSLTPPVWVE